MHLVPRVVPEAPVAFAHRQKLGRQTVEVAAQQVTENDPLARPGQRIEADGLTRELRVEPGERPLGRGEHEEPQDLVEEIVTGGPVDRPGPGQHLAAFQDLLHQDPGPGCDLAQPLQVGAGIGQPVDVIDANAIDHSLGHPAPEQGVGSLEHPLVFNPQPHQRIDVEEAPVAQVSRRRTPVGQSTVLLAQEGVQRVGVQIQGGYLLVDRGGYARILGEQAAELTAQHLLVPMAAAQAGLGQIGGQRQIRQGIGDESEVGRSAASGGPRQRDGQRARRHRDGVLVVPDGEAASVTSHANLACVDEPPGVVAQHGKQHLVAQALLGWRPFDVEEVGEQAGRAVFQDVPPPGVACADGHVVGDDVEQLAERVFTQPAAQTGVRLGAAQIGAHLLRIDDVVAVGAPRHRLEHRRKIDVAAAEVVEVFRDRRGLVEAELRP